MSSAKKIAVAVGGVVLVILVLRPWAWFGAIRRVTEPMPPEEQLTSDAVGPGTFVGALPGLEEKYRARFAGLTRHLFRESPTAEQRARWLSSREAFLQDVQEVLQLPDGSWALLEEDERSTRLDTAVTLAGWILGLGQAALQESQIDPSLEALLLARDFARKWSHRAVELTELVARKYDYLALYELLRWAGHAKEGALRSALERVLEGRVDAADWGESVRWEYYIRRAEFARPPEGGPVSQFWLWYIGKRDEKLRVASLAFQDAISWAALPPDVLWRGAWVASGPRTPPQIPGVRMDRGTLDELVRRYPEVEGALSGVRERLARHFRVKLMDAFLVADIVCQLERRRTGSWPSRFGEGALRMYGVPAGAVTDPFTGRMLQYYPNKVVFLDELEASAASSGYVTIRLRLKVIRELLEPLSPAVPLFWSPDAPNYGGSFEEQDGFYTTIWPVDYEAVQAAMSN